MPLPSFFDRLAAGFAAGSRRRVVGNSSKSAALLPDSDVIEQSSGGFIRGEAFVGTTTSFVRLRMRHWRRQLAAS